MIQDLAFFEFGSGTPVIILHGLFGWKRNWARIAKGLGETHRVLTLDMRNHGESPHAPTMTYPDMADDIARFMDQHTLGPCPVIGHSMGGKASMMLALSCPERVERLLVLDIAPVAYEHDYSEYIIAMKSVDFSRVSRRSDVQPVIAEVAKDPGIQAFLMQNLMTNSEGRYQWRINLDAIKSHMPDILDFPEIPSKQAYSGPTLFLGGRESNYIAPQHQSEIDRLFPLADVDFIDNAGHWVHAAQPAAVLERIRAFLL